MPSATVIDNLEHMPTVTSNAKKSPFAPRTTVTADHLKTMHSDGKDPSHHKMVGDEESGLLALQATAAANKAGVGLIPVWKLTATDGAIHDGEAMIFKNEGSETVVGKDNRVLVHPKDFAPGGKYRSIVKLFLYFKARPDSDSKKKYITMIATGWLIAPDLVVTAGHCAFDWANSLGPLMQAQAFIGYAGKASVHAPNSKVQMREGRLIATTAEWVKTKGSRQHDVSFIKLDKPFDGVKAFKFDSTPVKGNATIGVVGYPGDLQDQKTGEPGAHMYEMFLETRWQLAMSQWSMLEYMVDTAGGNSGSPVLRGSDMVSIGVHTYGGDPNSASVIGPYGNQFQNYIQALKVAKPATGIQYVSISPSASTMPTPKATTINPKPTSWNNERPWKGINPKKRPESTNEEETTAAESMLENPTTTSEENWLDFIAPILKKAGSVSLPTVLGPIGVPLSVLANVSINAAGTSLAHKHRSEGDLTTTTENVNPESFSGVTERAVLAEAAFHAMTKCDPRVLHKTGFFTRVRDNLKVSAPMIAKLGPVMRDTLGPVAVHLAMDAVQKGGQGAESSVFNPEMMVDVHVTVPEETFEGLPRTGQESFTARLKATAEALEAETSNDMTISNNNNANGNEDVEVEAPADVNDQENSEESWWKVIWNIAKPAMHIINSLKNGESTAVASRSPSVIPAELSDVLYTRAIVAEAVLQASMDTNHAMLQEEGFFSSVVRVVKRALPLVKKWAPSVVKAASLLVGESQIDGGDNGEGDGGEGEGGVEEEDEKVGELWRSLNAAEAGDDGEGSISFGFKWNW